MDKKEFREDEMSLMEAVDNLSMMAELDIPASPEEVDRDLLARTFEESKARELVDREHVIENRALVRETFRTVNRYLEHLYEKDKGHLKDPEVQRGVQSLMSLVGEAAQKLEAYTSMFKGVSAEGEISNLKEFQELQIYYRTKIIRRFRGRGEGEAEIDQEGESGEQEIIQIQKQGLKDLEMVRHDRDYELFYIRKENGHPFFSQALVRHLRLVGEFDQAAADLQGDDPFLKIKNLQDREAHHLAQELLKFTAPSLDQFYKEALHHKGNELIVELNKAVMALMLAANGRNLAGGESPKTCFRYLKDFLSFIRSALRAKSYEEALASQTLPSSFIESAISLAHRLVAGFFLHTSYRKEMVDFLQKMIEKSSKHRLGKGKMWEELAQIDRDLRAHIKRYPNGPIMKTLDTFREDEVKWGFDPFEQENFPSQLYTFAAEELHVSVLRIPAPIHQEVINRAEVVEEFQAFVRALEHEMKGRRHLMFNLQDRTSWKEYARCTALEETQKEAEFSRGLTVVTFNKSGDFYFQKGVYAYLDQADIFLSTFQQQIEGQEGCGFHFPASLSFNEIQQFTQDLLQMVHQQFFSSKATLSRKERLDFIEIFTQFFFLKIITMVKPDSISFTCKDAIDVGEAQAATFFAFLRVMGSAAPMNREEREFLLWMLYTPAFELRERLIDPFRFARFTSALTHLDTALAQNRASIIQAARGLLPTPGAVLPRIAA